jgi:hypothetical protein
VVGGGISSLPVAADVAPRVGTGSGSSAGNRGFSEGESL